MADFTNIDLTKLSANAYTNKYLGGKGLDNTMNPYIKGYFYVIFDLPDIFDTNTSVNVKNTLLSSIEGFTPPGDRQLKTEDLQGMGGIDSSFITGQQIDRTFSLQYREYWGAPIFRIHRQWTNIINPYAGGYIKSTTSGTSTFGSKLYKGRCWVIQTKPVLGNSEKAFDKDDIEKVFFFDGVFPRTDLLSVYDANITDNSVVKPQIQYSFDGFPLDETNSSILENAVTKLNEYKIDNGPNIKSSYMVFKNLSANPDN